MRTFAAMNPSTPLTRVPVHVPTNGVTLKGKLALPTGARGVVIFAQTVAEGHRCPCNLRVASALHATGMGTLLFDLLTPAEAASATAPARDNDVPFLAGRLLAVTRSVLTDPVSRGKRLGYFGSLQGAAAALTAAAWLGGAVEALVARSGRPDLADGAYRRVVSPALFIVGEREHELLALNRSVVDQMSQCRRELSVVPDAHSLVENERDIDHVAGLARNWFAHHLNAG